MNSNGRLIGVSLGPGDPGLITHRAWDALHRHAHWTYPVRKLGGESYALNIALRAGLRVPQTHTPLVFPMTHDPRILAKYWLGAAHAVSMVMRSGMDVCFLVEGDASLYSTFGYLARTVRALHDDFEIETIPGVSAYHAAAGRLGMSLADNDESVAIIPAAYGVAVIERLLNDFDTLVLLKIKPLLDELIDLLERHELTAHARFVEKAGTPEERVVNNIVELRGTQVNYLSLMLVRNPSRERGALVRGCRKKTAEGNRA
jgi:precorrin-2/cobalt-factor-2 C20-methyltransferase